MRGPFEDLGRNLRRMWHADVSVRGNVLRGVIWWTLVAILALAIIDLLTKDVLPAHGFNGGETLNTGLLVGVSLAYLATMTGTIFRGRLAEALRYTFLVWALVLTLVFFTAEAAGPISIIIPIAAVALYTVSNFPRPGRIPEPALLKGAAFGLLAFWALLLPSFGIIEWPLKAVVFLFILFSFLGMIVILPAFNNHPNPRLRVLAMTTIDINLTAGWFACALLILSYFMVFRDALDGLAPSEMFLADWGAVIASALAAWLVYRYLHRQLLKEVASSELSEIRYRLEGMGDMAPVVLAIKDFVELGDKERLVIKMTRSLLDAGLNEEESAQAIRGLLRYRDEPPAVWARWLIGDVRSSMERSRCKAVASSLDNLESVLVARNEGSARTRSG